MAKKKVVPKKRGKSKPVLVELPKNKVNPTLFAPGNEFWKARATHGRDKIFSTPEILWESAKEYFQYKKDNPLYEVQFKGRDNEMVHVPRPGPLTMTGLCLFLGVSEAYFRVIKNECKNGTRKDGTGFLTVIGDIERVIYSQQYEGAASGFYNANIIARALGLVEKQDVTSNGNTMVPEIKVYNSAPPMANDEKSVDTKRKDKN